MLRAGPKTNGSVGIGELLVPRAHIGVAQDEKLGAFLRRRLKLLVARHTACGKCRGRVLSKSRVLCAQSDECGRDQQRRTYLLHSGRQEMANVFHVFVGHVLVVHTRKLIRLLLDELQMVGNVLLISSKRLVHLKSAMRIKVGKQQGLRVHGL